LYAPDNQNREFFLVFSLSQKCPHITYTIFKTVMEIEFFATKIPRFAKKKGPKLVLDSVLTQTQAQKMVPKKGPF
jgi:hypothetical protein